MSSKQKKLKITIFLSEILKSMRGGIGAVGEPLAYALAKQGMDVVIFVPLYNKILPEDEQAKLRHILRTNVRLGWREQQADVHELSRNGVKFYFIENKYYFDREKIYDYKDDAERFAFFTAASLTLLRLLNYQPDVIHLNDWMTAVGAPMLKAGEFSRDSFYKEMRILFTIHNLKMQGCLHPSRLNEVGLDSSFYQTLEFYNDINLMKGALHYSDMVNTVSRTYAREIQTAKYGEGLDGVLREVGVEGIENARDKSFDPRTDNMIAYNYDISNRTEGKKQNKIALQRELNLPESADTPVLGVVARLDPQKGIQHLLNIMHDLMEQKQPVQLIVMGTGDDGLEKQLKEKDAAYINLCVELRFDKALARRIFAGCDIFVMNSVFEPCGISQMESSAYAAIPLCTAVGGLKDTMIPFYEQGGGSFVYEIGDAPEANLLAAIKTAIGIYKNHPEFWNTLTYNSMNRDFSWEQTAGQYITLYNKLCAI